MRTVGGGTSLRKYDVIKKQKFGFAWGKYIYLNVKIVLNFWRSNHIKQRHMVY